MKKVFIAYFDLLGYKDFILNNNKEHLGLRMGHVFREIESALAQGKYQEPKGGRVLADISKSKINSLNISDTIIFWTNDCSYESFTELIKVAYSFNWRGTKLNFPARGSVLCGDINVVKGEQKNEVGGTYAVSCLYGKGIVEAHLKAENQSWSGTVIDQSVFDEVGLRNDYKPFLHSYAKKYLIPYKTAPLIQPEEYALNLAERTLNAEAFNNYKEQIERLFSLDGKRTDSARVKEILANTIKFLETFRGKTQI